MIDDTSLETVRTMRPEPGATMAHVEFTRDGARALVSTWQEEGAVIVCDAKILEEITHLPMRKSSGKYNE
ncbi:cytochrome D1 domain-containing protein [Roseovarius sp. S4756]|uniref:cytochrome D1 domain-containing protein n=1 Tax=Roseovarius maritimus TaxID=3342637 RepID=UPI0037281598